jgi:hypothetical protein
MNDPAHSSLVSSSSQTVGQIQSMIGEIIFRDPHNTLQSSVELLDVLAESFGKLISSLQFNSLLAHAAHCADVDLSRFARARHHDTTTKELDLSGENALRLLAQLIESLIRLIGESLTLRQFETALRSFSVSDAKLT